MGLFTKDIKTMDGFAGPWPTGHLLRRAADHQIAAQDDRESHAGLAIAKPPPSRRPLQRAVVLRVTMGDLRAHQDDLRRVVDPD
jgi:hypothetical protein